MIITTLAILAIQSTGLQMGAVWSGEETLHFIDKQQEIDETHRFKLAFKITGSEDKMWKVERRSNLLGTVIGDTEVPSPANQDPAISKEWLSPKGFLMDVDPYDPGTFGLDRLIHFWLPRDVPDEWTIDLTSPPARFVNKATATLKAYAKSKPNAATREYAFTFVEPEDPVGIEAAGRMRFDIPTGRLLEAKIEVRRAELPGGHIRTNVTLTYLDSRMPKPPQ